MHEIHAVETAPKKKNKVGMEVFPFFLSVSYYRKAWFSLPLSIIVLFSSRT